MARRYTPAIVGLPKSKVPADIFAAHREQVARRAIHQLYTGINPRVAPAEYLTRDTCVYYFKRGMKFGPWHK